MGVQVAVFVGGGGRGVDGDEVAGSLVAADASRSSSEGEEGVKGGQARDVDLFGFFVGGFAEESLVVAVMTSEC